MKNYNQTYYNQFFEKGQQFINFNLYEIGLPVNDPVYTLKEVMEELDFTKLLSTYKQRGRKAFNPIMMFALITYANLQGIRSVDQIVERCTRDIAFMWLAQGERPKRDAFYHFMNDKLSNEILDDLHYQFMRKLKEKGFITLETLFIDGTKIEANANRYTFVWRGTVNFNLINLLDHIQSLFERYNQFIEVNSYDVKHGILKEEMFIIEGTERVKKIILENKQRKKINQKKLSNNTIVKIDNIGPQTIHKIKQILLKLRDKEGISFSHTKGERKTELQKLYEEFVGYGVRLLDYQEKFEVMGDDRHSYSKTDKDATFMRMKDDHMMNGQLKPGYNLQFGVENYFITDILITNDRTDYNTLIPLISKHDLMSGVALKEVTADSGYCSETNLDFLIKNRIVPYIKLQEHEIKKTRKYQKDIGKYYNMEEIIVSDDKENGIVFAYKCANGRLLTFQKKTSTTKAGYTQEYEHYECQNCEGCPLIKNCFYNYNEEKYKGQNKKLRINRKWDELKKITDTNIQSEKGILYRQIRSIQTEGTFGDMKHNDDFNRFNHKSDEKVYKETLLYVFGRNIDKLHRFKTGQLTEYKGN
jgi:transposase